MKDIIDQGGEIGLSETMTVGNTHRDGAMRAAPAGQRSNGRALVPQAFALPALPDPDTREEVWSALRPARLPHQDGEKRKIPRKAMATRRIATRAFEQLRTQLLQAVRAEGLSRIAVVAPRAGCGATFVAANLALGLSKIPACRVVLLDLNLRAPGLAQEFGIRPDAGIAGYLTGEVFALDHLLRHSQNLALGLTDRPCTNSSETLQSPDLAATLDETEGVLEPDLMLFDLPPMLDYDDLSALLPDIDGVLLVADGTRTQARHIAECERVLANRTKLLGIVLNRARVDQT